MTPRRTYTADIVGKLWLPMCDAATNIQFEALDPEEAEQQIYAQGDFSSITDYQLIETIHFAHITTTKLIHDWEDEDNENVFLNCMYPEE